MDKPKKTLHSLDKYIALGFDADHCLLRYKLASFFESIYKAAARILVEEKSYPQEMLEFGKKEKCFLMNGLVIDFDTLYILKLGENKTILRAYYGYERVSNGDLEAKYGSPPKYDIFDPYQWRTDRYLCGLSFFECYIHSLFAHMVEYKKKIHHPEQIHVREILEDCHDAIEKAVADYIKEGCDKPETIVYKQDKLKDLLLSLKAKGKILFIASNANPKYHDALMTHAFGRDWKSLFDFLITISGKPKFFAEQDTPFYEVDTNFEKIDKPVRELRQHQLYLGGNAKLLEENIARINAGKEGRVLFFGDHYSSDVLAAEKIDHWDGVCIIEELGDVDFGEGYDDSFWGHWQYEETPHGKIPTYWYNYMSQNVAMCTSLVDSIEMAEFYELSQS